MYFLVHFLRFQIYFRSCFLSNTISFPVKYEMIEFTNGEIFLSFQESLDILVLDIELPKINGITIKNRLQERREETLIF